ncbi:MAG TPA: Em GEA1 (EM1) [Thermodesulfobacteriota bacterium]|nr:Em GEA1 (EM1) [Thermodesulfobacteriota bacterium]
MTEQSKKPQGDGAMTVREAGRRGGEATSGKYGRRFYETIGKKGGQRVRELVEQGKRAVER